MKQNAMAVAMEVFTVRRQYTEEELSGFREQFVKEQLTFVRRDEEVKEQTKELREEVKALKEVADSVLLELNRGYEDKPVNCQLVPNYSEGIMQYIDPNGEVVHERRLFPQERQMSLIETEAANG